MDTSKEDIFIVTAARLALSDEDMSLLRKTVSGGLDWSLVEKKAFRHGVGTFIYYSFKKHNLQELVPEEVFLRFQKHYYANACRNTVLLDEITKLSQLTDDKVVLLKGADLMQYLYPNIAIRVLGDIDVLVEKHRAEAIWNKLLRSGYKKGGSDILVNEGDVDAVWGKLKKNGFCLTDASDDVHVFRSKEHFRLFVKEHAHLPALFSGGAMLEIHRNLLHRGCFSSVTDEAWRDVQCAGVSSNICRLADEFMLIHLCIHYYEHIQMAPLRMLCDINELVLKCGSLNWDKVQKICRQPELKLKMTVALTYTNHLFKTPVPACFTDRELIKNAPGIACINIPHPRVAEYSGDSLRFALTNIKGFRSKLVFLYRTFVPVRAWLQYHKKTNSYCKYWFLLFFRHILRKNIAYAG